MSWLRHPSRSRSRFGWVVWLALAAMLALALAPALSHALTFARGASNWVEVCTPQGMKLVAVDAADAHARGVPVQTAGHLEHCPYCPLHAPAAAPPPAAVAALQPLVLAGVQLPRLFLHAPHTLFAWRGAQPRGPPSVS